MKKTSAQRFISLINILINFKNILKGDENSTARRVQICIKIQLNLIKNKMIFQLRKKKKIETIICKTKERAVLFSKHNGTILKIY